MGARKDSAVEGKIAVLLMAYGGPDSLDEVEPYVMDIRGGRPVSEHFIEEIKERYRRIGGKSPLLELTRTQARALEKELTDQGVSNRTFVGMRHWQPRIREAVDEIRFAGLSDVVALCMAPQYSEMSIGAYFGRYREALSEFGLAWKTIYIESWHDHPLLLQAFAQKAREALSRFPAEVRPDVPILFTAHSLPERILSSSDPYDCQVKETAARVAQRLDQSRWVFAYQSQGHSAEKWLGPKVEEILERLASEGVENVLVAPIGFVSDHVEVLYDVDVHFRERAASLGLRLERCASLNDDPLFIRAMAATVRTHLQQQSHAVGS